MPDTQICGMDRLSDTGDLMNIFDKTKARHDRIDIFDMQVRITFLQLSGIDRSLRKILIHRVMPQIETESEITVFPGPVEDARDSIIKFL